MSADDAGVPPVTSVTVRSGLEYAVHDGVSLAGDFYGPDGGGAAPVVIALHGGAWQSGSRSFYQYWGPYLAGRGVAVFAVDYRLSGPGRSSFPQAVHDVRAAVQFVRGRAADLGADPRRIGLMGDSAGGHLSALAALAGDEPVFTDGAPAGPHAAESAAVSAVVSFYGIFDLARQWQHDLLTRPRNSITENFLGASPIDDRRIYFGASPLSYVTARPDPVSFLLIWGQADDMVDCHTQSEPFRDALKQAMFPVRTLERAEAGHFWASDPIDEIGSHSGFTAPRVLRFLQQNL